MLEHLPLIVFLVTFVLIFVLRMPIPAGMIAACTLYFLTDGLIKGVGFGALITGAGGSLHLVAQKTIEAIFTNGTIVAVPLFIFAANVMNAGKITEYVFGTCMGLVGRFRGGLAHVNVLASLVFSGMTGSAIADASGLGKLEIDAMRKEGYDDGFSCAITAASATIGPIFPPSIPMVVYAMLTGASVGALFMAGMVPGVLLAVALCVYVYFVAKKRNYPRTAPPKLRDYLLYLTKSIWAMLTPVILLVGIYTGIMTPTEAGAIAGLYALLVSFLIYRLMSWRTLKQVLVDTMKGTGSVSIMIGASGNTECSRTEQYRQIEDMMKIPGIGAYVLVSNRMDIKNEGEEAFRKNVDDVLAAFPEISFGIYECPMPWKRLLTLDFIRDYAPGGRLVFIKDTCCDYELIRRRLEAAKGTPMKLFNANCQSWYDSYCHGAGGYSGIMANFHPDIYKYCVTHKDTDPEKVQHANDFLTLAGMIERTCYPVSCKYYHQLVGVPMSTYCRSADPHRLDNAAKEEVEALIRMENHIREELGIG